MNDLENMLQLRARRGDLSWDPEVIRLFCYQRKQRTSYAAPRLELIEREQMAVLEPFLELQPCEAQKLMDDLWDCGLRPSEGSGSAGAMAATQKHLQDMKTIAFHALKIQRGVDK